jgi:hypothetical protein
MLEQQTLFPAAGGNGGDGSDALTLADFAQRAYLDYATARSPCSAASCTR